MDPLRSSTLSEVRNSSRKRLVERPKQRKEVNDLEFINISRPLEASNAKNRALVRSQVMRNFAQKQKRQRRRCNTRERSSSEDVVHSEPSPTASILWSEYSCDECEVVPQTLLGSHKGPAPVATKKTVCKKCGGQSLREQELRPEKNCPVALRGEVFDPFNTLLIDTTRPQTRELLHHAVCNLWPSLYPLGDFSPVDSVNKPLMNVDELVFHANVFAAGFHLAALQGKENGVEGMRHRAKTIQILKKRLQDPSQATSVSSITAVVLLFTQALFEQNGKEIRIHGDGLARMAREAGGLENLHAGNADEVLYWSDILAAIITDTCPRFEHPATPGRLNFIPIFPDPRSPINTLGRGFCAAFNHISPFYDLLELVNQVRCIALVLHTSRSCGRPHVPFRSFYQRGAFIKDRLLALANPYISSQPFYYLFECCRYSTLIFSEFVLYGAADPKTSTWTELDVLATKLFESVQMVQHLDICVALMNYADLFFWMLCIAFIATSVEQNKAYFLKKTAQAASFLRIKTWQEAETVLMKFLYVEFLSDGPLQNFWNELLLEQRKPTQMGYNYKPRS